MDDDLDDLRRRRRARRAAGNRRTLVIVAAVVAMLLVPAGIWFVTRGVKKVEKLGDRVVSNVAGPSEEKEGETWSHKELLEHLVKKGVAVEGVGTILGSLYGPAAYFARDEKALADILDHDQHKFPLDGRGVVYVQKRKTIQEAKDESAVRGAKSFSWGRFVFDSTDPDYLARVKAALN